MLKSDGTKWVVFDGAKKVLWDNIEGKPSTFTPASHTHGYISNDGAITDAMATTPASGDKIVVTDSSDSNKVKGAITIGSDDGKFLKHDGTWGEELFTIEVFDHSKDPSWDGTGTQWEVKTPWADVMAAVSGWIFSNDPKIVLLQTHHYAEEGDALYRLNDIHSDDGAIFVQGYRFSENADLSATLITCNVIVLAVMETTGTVLQGIEADIPLLSPPLAQGTLTPVDGTYSLNVSSGVSSWTAAGSGGPDTPDAPTTDGNYVLNVDSGSSSWQEETKEVVEIIFDQLYIQGSIPYIYTSTGGYRTVVSLCQQKVAKVIIAGSVLDTIFQTTGMSDIICTVTGCVETSANSTCLLRYSSITLLSGSGIQNKPVVGALKLMNLDPGIDGACFINPSYFLTNQYYFEPMMSNIDSVAVTQTQVGLTNGLLSITTNTNYVNSVRSSTENYTVKKID